MALEDFPKPQTETQTPPESTDVSLESRLAAPLDRLAAAIADFVLISPIAAFIMSPFRRIASEAMLQGRDDAWMISTAASVGLSVLVVILYQTIFLVKWRATPGKRLFGLTVETLWSTEGSPIRPQAAFMRACALCFELLLLGLPLIGVIGNDRRRPLHDRLADTIVLSKRRSKVGVPGLSEKSLASGLVGAFFMSLLIVMTFKVGQLRNFTSSAAATDGDNAALCENVARADQNWVPAIGEKKPSRISIALALFEAEAIDESCLKLEADATLWGKGERELGYLARGLAEKVDEFAQDYFDKACDTKKQTDACRAVAILNRGERPDDPVEAKAADVVRDSEILALTSSINASTQPFMKVLAIRELMSHRQEGRALALLDAMSPQHDLAFFFASERTKALWALGQKPEARSALKSVLPSLDGDQRVAMTRWFCQAETSSSGCSVAARTSCDLLAASVEKDKILLGDPEVTSAYLKGEACADRLTVERLADLKADAPDINSQTYIEALTQIAKGDEPKAVEVLHEIASKEDGPYFIEAQLKLVSLAKSEKELTDIRESWSDADPTLEGWVSLGRALMERYNDFKSWDKTVEVGFKIGENEPQDASTARPLVVAAYRSGQTQMAIGYWQTYFKNKTSGETALTENGRAPASTDGFDEAVRGLEVELNSPPVVARSHAMPRALPSKTKPSR